MFCGCPNVDKGFAALKSLEIALSVVECCLGETDPGRQSAKKQGKKCHFWKT
jgi:hypothetical protein